MERFSASNKNWNNFSHDWLAAVCRLANLPLFANPGRKALKSKHHGSSTRTLSFLPRGSLLTGLFLSRADLYILWHIYAEHTITTFFTNTTLGRERRRRLLLSLFSFC